MDDLAFGDDDDMAQPSLRLFDSAVQLASTTRSPEVKTSRKSKDRSDSSRHRQQQHQQQEQQQRHNQNAILPASSADASSSSNGVNESGAAAATAKAPGESLSLAYPRIPSSDLRWDDEKGTESELRAAAAAASANALRSSMHSYDRKPSAEPTRAIDRSQSLTKLHPPSEPCRESSFYKSLLEAHAAGTSREDLIQMMSSSASLLSQSADANSSVTDIAALIPTDAERQSSFYLSLLQSAGSTTDTPSNNNPGVGLLMKKLSVGEETYADNNQSPPPTTETERKSSFFLSLFAPPEDSSVPSNPPEGGVPETGATSLTSAQSLTNSEIMALIQASEGKGSVAPASPQQHLPPSLTATQPPPALSTGRSLTPEEIMAAMRLSDERDTTSIGSAAAAAAAAVTSGHDVHLVGQALDPDQYEEQLLILARIREEQASRERAALERKIREKSVAGLANRNGGFGDIGGSMRELDGPASRRRYDEYQARGAAAGTRSSWIGYEHEGDRYIDKGATRMSTPDAYAWQRDDRQIYTAEDFGGARGARSAANTMDVTEWRRQQEIMREREERRLRKMEEQEGVEGPIGGTVTDVRNRRPHQSAARAPDGTGAKNFAMNQELLMRGNKETWEAIANGEAHVVKCLGCKGRMQVARSAALVFCPICRTISPARPSFSRGTSSVGSIGSIGSDHNISKALQQQEFQAILRAKGMRAEDVSDTNLHRAAQDRLNQKLQDYNTNRTVDRRVEEKIRFHNEEMSRKRRDGNHDGKGGGGDGM